jgi:flagellar hook-associated protein 1 FlgK
VVDGMKITVGGGAAVTGDRFLIKPTEGAVAGLDVAITDPAKVAAAAPIATSAGTANTGGATVSGGEVLDATNPQLRSNVTIQFLTATTYSVNGAGSFTYTPGGNIDVNGWRVQIAGAPAVGDTFKVANNLSGVGDNKNMLKLVDSVSTPVLNGGTASLNDASGQFVAGIGTMTNQAQSASDAQKVVFDEGVSAQSAVSGVNLDEEAANLLRYQQAYQAAAQMIRVADTLFQTVLQATQH